MSAPEASPQERFIISPSPEELEWLREELRHFTSRAGEEEAGELRALEEALPGGQLSPGQSSLLGALLEAGLASGRIRALYGAHAEMAAQRLHAATPQGKELQQAGQEINQALASLQGQCLRALQLNVRGGGSYTLTLHTDTLRLVLSLSPAGPQIRSLELAL